MFTVLLPIILACVSGLLTEGVHANHHDLVLKSLKADIDKEAQKLGPGAN